ncbi:MAG TPA: MurR/RpiR family transcriptional regulator [Ferrovibrio sp.]|uniref:MurR/RpiR family transcriptional regulator n=1 Tax=Ferrovibrio sp. TaxID=1917215 RepID=UPI002B4AFFE8|nr:MurR/RpiR family transcriptional regulator [Ferrovibrio sp.]HLT76850.1 MurR/RpiR family transcriptional regulator [Ferrovibrio sp.]
MNEPMDPASRITEAFDRLPPQLQAAARFVLDHPDDVALLSMREQARRAGVPPVTMTRLARQLGFGDYREFRELHARGLRRSPASHFSERAGSLQQNQKMKGDAALAAQIGWTVAEHVAGSHDDGGIATLIAAARQIEKARRVYFLGARSCHSVAFHAHYVYSLFRDNGLLLDGAGDTGSDALRHATADDVLLAVSVAPYASVTLERAAYAARHRRTSVVALTDSKLSPIGREAAVCLLVRTTTPSFFHAMTPAFALAETLIALLAARAGDKALGAIRNSEAQLDAFATFSPSNRRKRIP